LAGRRKAEFTDRLLSWYRGHGRSFPWRRTGNPYRVWFAEVLLQRTRSDLVAREYEKIVKVLPDIHNVRNASLATVRKTIRRLGLPHRATYLKRAATYVTTEFEGRFPKEPEKLRSIPGVGDYTANAVALFAYNKRAFPVDVNVVRVLDRAFGIKSSKSRPQMDMVYPDFLETAVPKGHERDFMYGLLDLASEICVDNKRTPKCALCPMPDICAWYQQNVR